MGNTSGWGGRIADLFAAGNGNSLFTCISPAGDSLFLTGLSTGTYSISPTGGAIAIQSIVSPLFGSSACQSVMKALTTAQRTDASGNLANLFESTYANVVTRSLTGQQVLGTALPAATVTTFPTTTKTNLSAQLSMVARVIAARNASGIGATRQVFMVGAGNFDTHDAVDTLQPPLLSDVAVSMAAFYAEMNALGLQNNVTSFTVSDFGRTLNSDGDGSDHGWGSVHFVIGGAVNGNNFYGTSPRVAAELDHSRPARRRPWPLRSDHGCGSIRRDLGLVVRREQYQPVDDLSEPFQFRCQHPQSRIHASAHERLASSTASDPQLAMLRCQDDRVRSRGRSDAKIRCRFRHHQSVARLQLLGFQQWSSGACWLLNHGAIVVWLQ